MQITLSEKQLINYFVDGQEDACIEIFLTEGPKGLRGYLGVPEDRDDIWESVYHYFIFEKKILLTAVSRFQDFLTDVMTAYGPQHLRKMFQIEDKKYDELFSGVLNYIGVSRKGLFQYVRRNALQLIDRLHEEGSDAVRLELNISEDDDIWKEILDILLERVSMQKIHERKREHVKEFFRAMRKQLKI